MVLSIPKKSKERELDSLKMFRELTKKHVRGLKPIDFKTGNMIAFSYNALDKDKVYDKTPLSLILWRTKGYTLGLNFHWVPRPVRYIIVEYILKNNIGNIKNGRDIIISYKMLKPILLKLNLRVVIRLYINSRISTKGIVIPPELFRKAVDLPSEHFTGLPPEEAYYRQIKRAKKKPKAKPVHKPTSQRKKRVNAS